MIHNRFDLSKRVVKITKVNQVTERKETLKSNEKELK